MKDVYQFCSSYDRTKVGDYLQFLLRTRDAIAEKFRAMAGTAEKPMALATRAAEMVLSMFNSSFGYDQHLGMPVHSYGAMPSLDHEMSTFTFTNLGKSYDI